MPELEADVLDASAAADALDTAAAPLEDDVLEAPSALRSPRTAAEDLKALPLEVLVAELDLASAEPVTSPFGLLGKEEDDELSPCCEPERIVIFKDVALLFEEDEPLPR